MGQAWVEHLVEHNYTRVMQSIARAEEETADTHTPMVGLDDVLSTASQDTALSNDTSEAAHAEPPSVGDRTRGRLAASTQHLAAGAEKAGPAFGPLGDWLRRLSAAFAGADGADAPSLTSAVNVGIRDLSAARIERAAEDGELLILTNDRVLIGVVVPVSQRLVEFLIAQNLTRVMQSIHNAEHSVAAKNRFSTLDDALAPQHSEAGP
jgi:hypothetical protein